MRSQSWLDWSRVRVLRAVCRSIRKRVKRKLGNVRCAIEILAQVRELTDYLKTLKIED